MKVAGSLVTGPLALRQADVSTSSLTVNRGAVVSPIVLLHLPNCLPFAVLAFGVLASGMTVRYFRARRKRRLWGDADCSLRTAVDQFTAANPVLTPSEIAHILSLSKPAVIVTTPSGLANFQAAFATLDQSLQAELGYATKGNVFIVDVDADDYGASASSLAQPASSIVGGWRVQNWKTLLPANPVPFTPPQ